MTQTVNSCREPLRYPWNRGREFREGDYAYARVRATHHKPSVRPERSYDLARHFAKEIADRRKPAISSLELDFKTHSDQWKKETRILSSISAKIHNPHYQRIIGMGKSALPLIFSELKNNGGQWYWALECICGENPAMDAKTLPEAKQMWLEYGIKNNYLSNDSHGD